MSTRNSGSNYIDKTIPSLNLDEVFVTKAPRAKAEQRIRLHLSPLSALSCRIHGIDPSVLLERDHASFYEPNLDPEIQTMRYEAYSFTRSKLFQLASTERIKLAAKSNERKDSVSGPSSLSVVSSNSGREATLIELTKKRSEKLATRQKNELMRLISFEVKSQEMIAKMNARAEEQKKKEATARKEKKRKDARAAELARQREHQKKREEEKEEAMSRLAQEERDERERLIQLAKLKREREAKKKAIMEEKRRIEKREEFLLKTKRIFHEQKKVLEEKMLQREHKDEALNVQLELKRLVELQASAEKRKVIQKRIENNLAARRTYEETKRNEFLRRQARHDEISIQKEKERTELLLKQQQRNEMIERKRKQQLELARESERSAKLAAEEKIHQQEAHLEDIARQRRREQTLIKAERELQLQMKKDNLERLKKKQSYRHSETMKRVQENEFRTQELLRQRDELMRIRAKNAAKAKIEKDRLLSVLEKSTKAGCSIQKLLKQVSLTEAK